MPPPATKGSQGLSAPNGPADGERQDGRGPADHVQAAVRGRPGPVGSVVSGEYGLPGQVRRPLSLM